MTTAIVVIILVFAFIIGGMMTLLNTANKYKFPKTYDKSKVGFDDEDDWPKQVKTEETNLDVPTDEEPKDNRPD